MTTHSPSSRKPLTLDRLHRQQCRAAERHSRGAFPEAIGEWGSILRDLLPHILTKPTGGRLGKGPASSLGLRELPVALWVAPVAFVPQADEGVFVLFPFVLAYTMVGVGDGNDDSDENGSGSSADENRLHPRRLRLSGSELRRIGAGVAYNLALAYHMQAMQDPPGVHGASLLKTALHAYKAARDMLLSVDAGAPSSYQRQLLEPSEDDRLLLLAIANNEGQIWEALHERGLVAEALERLRSGLARARDPSGLCGHFTVTDALFGDGAVVRTMHAAAA